MQVDQVSSIPSVPSVSGNAGGATKQEQRDASMDAIIGTLMACDPWERSDAVRRLPDDVLYDLFVYMDFGPDLPASVIFGVSFADRFIYKTIVERIEEWEDDAKLAALTIEDWRERALVAEARVAELEEQLAKQPAGVQMAKTTYELSVMSRAKALQAVKDELKRSGVLVNDRGCMVYQGTPNAGGYARVRNQAVVDGKKASDQAGHRVSVRAFCSDDDFQNMIQKGYHASHLCHLRVCMWHVIVEPQGDNMKRNHCAKAGVCICALEPQCHLVANDEDVTATIDQLRSWGIEPVVDEKIRERLGAAYEPASGSSSLPIDAGQASSSKAPKKRAPRVCQYCLLPECTAGTKTMHHCDKFKEDQKKGTYKAAGRVRKPRAS